MDLPNNSISLPNGVWSSRTQTLQSLSDDQLSAIREQSRASLHNPSPQSYSRVTINGREYSVTYHPQDDNFSVQRINEHQGRFVQWLYRIAGHPRDQITQQLAGQLNSPGNHRNYQVTSTVPEVGENSVPVSQGQSVFDRQTPSAIPDNPAAQTMASLLSPTNWADKLTNAIVRQNNGETLSPEERNFSNANFIDIDFRELLSPDLRDTDGYILVNGFNFSNARFDFTTLPNFHFDQCNFTGSNTSCINLINARFTNSDLSEMRTPTISLGEHPTYYSNVTFKNSVIFKHMDLSGIILNEPDNSSPPVDDVIRLGDAWLAVPSQWDERNLDIYLNHEHNEGKSLLMAIDSLPEKYSQEKVQTMEELVMSLRDACLSENDIRPVESSLVSVLAHPPYTQNALISEWLRPVQERFFTHQCQTYNEVQLPVSDKSHQQRILPVLLDSFQKDNAAMTTHSGFFNQVILHSMTGADGTDDTRQKAAALYDQYLACPAVSPHINNGLFGNYDGSPDWTTRTADNFLLLSSRTPDTAMMLSADTLLTMLNPTPDTAWDRFYLLRAGENVSTAQISPEELFRHDFKVFSAGYNKEAQTRNFGKLINTILSPAEHGELNRQFIAATNQKHSTVKFIDDASVSRLNAVFEPLLPEGKLSPAHYQHILSAYNLTDASPQEQAKTLFCLSTTFARYSSSAIFGTENDSPPVLRGYAEALMQKAWELSPAIFPSEHKFTDWSNRFHGFRNAFTCTSIVAGDMQRHARAHFPDVLSSILPLAWG